MRIDLFLKKSRLIKNRNLAQKLIDDNRVYLNAKITKPGKNIKVGDIISIDYTEGTIKVEVLNLPQGNINKDTAKTMFRQVDDDK
ncbi:RNA-binding S4 domain-containing protein [bacterium]|nr:RNA-binding S4 domain-containing protein [bacterium]